MVDFQSSVFGFQDYPRAGLPESGTMFDFIIGLHNHCNGNSKSQFKSLDLFGKVLIFFPDYSALLLNSLPFSSIKQSTKPRKSFEFHLISGKKKFF